MTEQTGREPALPPNSDLSGREPSLGGDRAERAPAPLTQSLGHIFIRMVCRRSAWLAAQRRLMYGQTIMLDPTAARSPAYPVGLHAVSRDFCWRIIPHDENSIYMESWHVPDGDEVDPMAVIRVGITGSILVVTEPNPGDHVLDAYEWSAEYDPPYHPEIDNFLGGDHAR